MNNIVFIETDRLILRAPEESDIPLVTSWINRPEMRNFLLVRTPKSIKTEREWIEGVTTQPVPPRDIVFIIVEKESKEAIGLIAMHQIDWINRRATTGSFIGDPGKRGKGFGREAKQALLAYAFDTLGLHKMNSEANADNLASQKCLMSCGYVQEGVRREDFLIAGKRVDSILFGITVDDWRRLCEKKKEILAPFSHPSC